MLPIRQIIRTWWKHLFLIIFIMCWFLLTNYVLSGELKFLFALGYAIVFPCLIWMVITTILISNKTLLIARFHRRKPGSKPFEYLFFTFLFIASYYVTYIFSKDILSDVQHFLWIMLILWFVVFGAFSFGWLHYMERIEG